MDAMSAAVDARTEAENIAPAAQESQEHVQEAQALAPQESQEQNDGSRRKNPRRKAKSVALQLQQELQEYRLIQTRENTKRRKTNEDEDFEEEVEMKGTTQRSTTRSNNHATNGHVEVQSQEEIPPLPPTKPPLNPLTLIPTEEIGELHSVAVPVGALRHPYIWQYEQENSWHNFDLKLSDSMEDTLLGYFSKPSEGTEPLFAVPQGGVTTVVNFATMKQTIPNNSESLESIADAPVRNIRRLPVTFFQPIKMVIQPNLQ